MSTRPQPRRALRFAQVSCEVAARPDVGAPAAIVHGVLSSLEALSGADEGFDAQDVAAAIDWPLRNVQAAVAKLKAAGLVELVPHADKRVRRYRVQSAQVSARISAQDPARISEKSAPKVARKSAPVSVEVRAESGAQVEVHTSLPDLDRSGERGRTAPEGARTDPDPGQLARNAWSRAIESRGGIPMDHGGRSGHDELVAIEEAADKLVVKLAAPATLLSSERRRRQAELISTWADQWVGARYERAKTTGERTPRLRVAWWAESCAEAAAAGGRMPGVAKARGMSIGQGLVAARDAHARLEELTAGAADALEGIGE